MIEPPKNVGDCKKIFAEFGLDIMAAPMAEGGVALFYRAGKLAAILNELEALRALTNELAASNCMTMNEEATEYCIFCGQFKWSGHEENCLVARAKGLVK